MNSLPKNFCVAPFIQCTTHPSTSFSPCPYLGGTVWDHEQQNIMSQWQSRDLQQLRQSFVEDKQSPICNRCWHEESNNKRSLRLRLFDPVNHTSDYGFINGPEYAATLIQSVNNQSYLKGPEVLTIKNGNVCNAKCRVCHPHDSSRWAEDAEKLSLVTGEKYYPIGVKEKNWSDEQLDEILELSRNLKRLELFGGEPMYNKQVHRLLKRIVDQGDAKHIILYINTNGSVDILDRIPFISEFAEIEIGVSIDGVGQHFDYIRHGLDYNTVKQNVVNWRNYFEKAKIKHSIDSISTVNILNVFYLPELKAAVKEILPLAPFWNLLVEPEYLFIKNMPDTVKSAVIAKLSNDPEFEDLISVIQQPGDPEQWQRFLTFTAGLDQIRQESFDQTFPEFAAIKNRYVAP
jgi:MoaA/NifB/PqqE/SkfB family radical SAM enzyme